MAYIIYIYYLNNVNNNTNNDVCLLSHVNNNTNNSNCCRRKGKTPGKDNLRLYIRAHAVRPRCSPQSPWVVSEEHVKQYNLPSKLAPLFTSSGYKPSSTSVPTKRKASSSAANSKPTKALKISSTEVAGTTFVPNHHHNDVRLHHTPESSDSSNGSGLHVSRSGITLDDRNGGGTQHDRDNGSVDSEDDIEFLGATTSCHSNSISSKNTELIIPNIPKFNIPQESQLLNIPDRAYPNPLLSQIAAAQAAAVANLPHFLTPQNLPQTLLAAAHLTQQQSSPMHEVFSSHSIFSPQNTNLQSSFSSFMNSANSSLSPSNSFNNSPNCSVVAGKNLVLGSDGKLHKKRGRPVLSESEKARKREFQKQMITVFANVGVTSSPNRPKSPSSSNESPSKYPLSPSHFTSPSRNHLSTQKTPQKKAPTPESVMKLPIVRRLLFEHRNRKTNKGFARKVVYTMDNAITKLSIHQINLITDDALKESLIFRYEKMQEKKILQNMTPENREVYLKEKAKEIATKKRQEKQALNKKLEDQSLQDLVPLPKPSPVVTIDGVPKNAFSDIVMLTEFLECFCEVFNLNGSKSPRFTTNDILEAVSQGKQGYSYLSSLLCTMLPTVLYDSAMTHYKELGIPLREMPISYQTAPELARLCLKHQKQDLIVEEISEDGEDLIIGEEEDELSEDLLQKLSSVELWELSSQELVAFLTALTHRCMASDTLAAHVDRMEDMATKIYKERANIKKERVKEDFETKKKKREERNAKKQKVKKPPGRPKGYSPRLGMTIADFYECKTKDHDVSPRKELFQNRQKRKSTMERMEEEKKEQERRDVEKQKVDREERFRECQEILQKRRQTLRVTPLGKDRDHNRYWLFHSSTPGLFVEKGSLHNHMDYIVHPEDDSCSEATATSSNDEDDNGDTGGVDSIVTPTKGRPKSINLLDMDADNQTLPKSGNNLWYVYKTEDEIDKLIDALSDRGIREHYLKINLINSRDRISNNLYTLPVKKEINDETDCQTPIKNENNIKEEIMDTSPPATNSGKSSKINSSNPSIAAASLESPVKTEEDSEAFDCCKQMFVSLKEDIIQIEKELIEGYLGGVEHFDSWESQVDEVRHSVLFGDIIFYKYNGNSLVGNLTNKI